MSGLSIKYDADKALKLTRSIVDRMNKNNTVMDVIATMAWKNVLEHFEDEQGKKRSWPRPKWTNNRRPTKRGGNKLLRDTGFLRNSIRPRTKNDEAHVYTRTNYAKYHQFGTSRIPKRDFMWLAQDKINSMAKKFIRWIVSGKK